MYYLIKRKGKENKINIDLEEMVVHDIYPLKLPSQKFSVVNSS